MGVSSRKILPANKTLNNKIVRAAEKLNIQLRLAKIHSSDVFYRLQMDEYKAIHEKFEVDAVEMEAFALFANAKALKKRASCILTVSDSLVKNEATSAQERQMSFTKMMEIALNSI